MKINSLYSREFIGPLPMAICTTCKLKHELSDMVKQPRMKYGVGCYCKKCSLLRHKNWENRNQINVLLSQAKRRSKENGLEFTISKEHVIITERCPVLGIRLERATGKASPASPSIDRIDSTRGYIPGNVAVISWRANRLKSDSTIPEMSLLVSWMRANLPTEQRQSQSAA